jgi:phosphoribosylanthranilate isomerase
VADVRVKICGLTRREDAQAADQAGADYLGMVLTAGFGRSVAPKHAAAIVAQTRAKKVAVLVDETAADAELAARSMGADVIQLHGDEPTATVADLRTRGPWTLWKAVRAKSLADLEGAVDRYGELVDGLLLEGWREGSKGGSGARVTLDPEQVRALIPPRLELILAGGLGPDTVADAVRTFRPDVVDVSSGVEHSVGAKDHERVHVFVEAARSALAAAGEKTG